MSYPNTERSKYSNYTVNPSRYGKENRGIHFHHHRQVRLIHYFGREQTPLLTTACDTMQNLADIL